LFAALTGRWATVPLGFDSHALSYPLNLVASRLVEVHPFTVDTQHLSVRGLPNESLDLICCLFDASDITTNQRNPELTPLPAVLARNLSDADLEPGSKSVDDWLEKHPLLF